MKQRERLTSHFSCWPGIEGWRCADSKFSNSCNRSFARRSVSSSTHRSSKFACSTQFLNYEATKAIDDRSITRAHLSLLGLDLLRLLLLLLFLLVVLLLDDRLRVLRLLLLGSRNQRRRGRFVAARKQEEWTALFPFRSIVLTSWTSSSSASRNISPNGPQISPARRKGEDLVQLN